jgi:protein-tyrosine phosphatase
LRDRPQSEGRRDGITATEPAAIGMTEVLVLCTANICRSPMAAALLTRRLAVLGSEVRVRSAGLLAAGQRPPAEAVRAMADYRLDIGSHRSSRVCANDIQSANLILAMSRDCLRHAVVLEPAVWSRAFTLKEVARRSDATGQRPAAESVTAWLARVHEGRSRSDLLGNCPEDDVADPIGGPQRAYHRTAAVLSSLVDALVDNCWPDAVVTR